MCELISLEKQVLENALHEWETMPVVGASYTEQVQKNVSSTSSSSLNFENII